MKRRDAFKKTALVAGSAIATPSLFSLLQSCQEQSRLDWQPKFLAEEQVRLVSAMVDTILPKTETSGGLDVKVDVFVDLVISELYDKEGQISITQEMSAFDESCKNDFGKSFDQLTTNQRAEVLTIAESKSGKFNGSVWGTAVGVQAPVGFYRNMKSMILWGYFSSEEIGKNLLNYDPIPGEYRGCIPLADIGNTWSL